MRLKKYPLFFVTMCFFSLAACADGEFNVSISGLDHLPGEAVAELSRPPLIENVRGSELVFQGDALSDTLNFSVPVDDIHYSMLRILNRKTGKPWFKIPLVAEPESVNIVIEARGKYRIDGGKYNAVFVNSFRDNDAYQAALKSLSKVSIGDKGWGAANTTVQGMKLNILRKLSQNEDPIVRVLTYTMGYYGENPQHRIEQAELLHEQLQGHRQAVLNLRAARNSFERLRVREAIQIGTTIKDFSAPKIDGSEFHLSDILDDRKYILVEFWASWCGPCRMEIPHMKKAYQKYRKKGFEIASFTLDSDMEDWEVASEEEEIPWLNLGDLKAMQSPVAKLYGVSGVPTNYLVEGGTGKIIAKNLRQDALDKKLAELLEGSTAMD